MTTRPDLTDAEVDEICAGLTQNAAKCRYLRSLGLRVERRWSDPDDDFALWMARR